MQKKLKKKSSAKKEISGKENIDADRPGPNKTKPKQKYWKPLTILVLTVLTLIAYQPALDNEFVDWDDYAYVVDNDLVRQKNSQTEINDLFSKSVSLNYHPGTILTMRWNNNLCAECPNGISARPFIKWNIILHVLNMIMVFFLTFLLSNRSWFVGMFCAIVFALHPMHVESVAWVSERKDVLYVFFFLAGLLFYNRYLDGLFSKSKKSEFKWIALAFVCFVLSCLSKAMAVVFPLVMILMHFWKSKAESNLMALRNTFTKKRLFEYILFLAVALFFGLMAISIQSGKDFGGMLQANEQAVAISEFKTFTVFQRFQFAAYGFWMYIYKFFVPAEFSTLHPYSAASEYKNNPVYIFLFLGMIIALAAVAFSIKRTRLFIFSIGFYFITVAFVLQFISVGVAIIAERYTYLPYVGLSFLIAALAEKVLQKFRYLVYGLVCVASITWFLQTRSLVDNWQDSDKLWAQVIKLYPKNDQAYGIRGNYYGKQASNFGTKGDTAMQRQYIEKAEQDFNKGIQLHSTRVDVYEGMGNIQGMKGNLNEALKMYSRAIELNPRKSSSYMNRGVTYNISGNLQEALKDFSKAIELDPNPVHFLYRGILREAMNDKEGAKKDYRQVLQLAPNNEEALKKLRALGG